MRLVSVGLMVLAPRPVACEPWLPGARDALLLAEEGVWTLPPARGERGTKVDSLLWSGVRVLPEVWLGRGGGWTDLAFAALELDRILVVSADELSMDVLVRSTVLSCRLGLLF
jgi:hypothetical protein